MLDNYHLMPKASLKTFTLKKSLSTNCGPWKPISTSDEIFIIVKKATLPGLMVHLWTYKVSQLNVFTLAVGMNLYGGRNHMVKAYPYGKR